MFGGGSIQRVKNETGFHSSGLRFGIQSDQGVQPARAIQDQSASNGLTCQTCACPAREYRNLISGGKLDRSLKIILRFGNNHALRLNLIDGCIGTVEDPRREIIADIACEMFLEVVDEIGGKGHEFDFNAKVG